MYRQLHALNVKALALYNEHWHSSVCLQAMCGVRSDAAQLQQ
jgi:hypothetical protein